MPAVAELGVRETGRARVEAGVGAGAGPEGSQPEFLGKVFARSSPVLTWRPMKVQRITPGSSGVVERVSDSDAHRFSRAPTKRIEPLPVLPHVQGSKRRAFRALLTLVAFSLLCGSALTLCVYALLGTSPSAWHPKEAPVRIGLIHVADERFDTLLSASVLPEPAPAEAAPRHATARPWGGRVQRGHAYPAGSLHARHAPHAGGPRSAGSTGGMPANHRTT